MFRPAKSLFQDYSLFNLKKKKKSGVAKIVSEELTQNILSYIVTCCLYMLIMRCNSRASLRGLN